MHRIPAVVKVGTMSSFAAPGVVVMTVSYLNILSCIKTPVIRFICMLGIFHCDFIEHMLLYCYICTYVSWWFWRTFMICVIQKYCAIAYFVNYLYVLCQIWWIKDVQSLLTKWNLYCRCFTYNVSDMEFFFIFNISQWHLTYKTVACVNNILVLLYI